jgi:probable rRNA maturation factor
MTVGTLGGVELVPEPEPGSTSGTAMPEQAVEIAVSTIAGAWNDDDEGLCQRAAGAALRGRAATCTELSLVLADDATVRRLNHEYRGKDSATNVLSFPPAFDDETLLGDVVLAEETVRREAVEQGKARADHATHLVVHGCLHLLGYDHEDDEEARRMEALEVEILATLGVADPYQEVEFQADGGQVGAIGGEHG